MRTPSLPINAGLAPHRDADEHARSTGRRRFNGRLASEQRRALADADEAEMREPVTLAQRVRVKSAPIVLNDDNDRIGAAFENDAGAS